MTHQQAQAYYATLTPAQAHRFKTLVRTGLQLGKPSEGAYDYALAILKSEGEKLCLSQ